MGKLFVVMYHYTRDLKHSRYPEIKGLDVSLFREQIEFMKQQFNIVSMEQVIEAVERHADLPDKALLLTFDDGYVDNYTFAFPILEEFGIQGSFFIPGKTFATHQLLNVNKIAMSKTPHTQYLCMFARHGNFFYHSKFIVTTSSKWYN